MDDAVCSDVIKHHWSATDETVVPSSEVPPPWFADAAGPEVQSVDRVDDQPIGFSAFFASSELSSSNGNGFFGEPAPPAEPAWHDDPAVRALAPSPESEPASPPVVSDAPAVDPRDDPGPRTFVFVNGVATVVPYTRAEALARGYAVVEYEDEATGDAQEPQDAQDTENAQDTRDNVSGTGVSEAPTEVAQLPIAQPPIEAVEPPSLVPLGETNASEAEGSLARTDEVAPAVRSEDWPAAESPAPVEPVTWSRPPVDALPPWLVQGVSTPVVSTPGVSEQPAAELTAVDLGHDEGAVGNDPDSSALEPVLDESELPDESDVLDESDMHDSELDDPVVEHPVFAEPAVAEQLVQIAVSGNAPMLSASAPEASDPESILSWLRGLAPDEEPIVEEPFVEEPFVEEPFATPQGDVVVTSAPVVESPSASTAPPDVNVVQSFQLRPQGFEPIPTNPATITPASFTPAPISDVAVETPPTETADLRPTAVRPSDPDSDLRFATGPWAGSPAKVDADAPAIIEAKGLGRAYRKGSREIVVLRDIDLTIRQGEFVAITGPSGSGKTTLLHCLAGLDDLSAGTVVVDGFELHNLTDGERSRHRSAAMGFAFQSYNLVPSLTALENVELPLMLNNWPQDASAEEARAALDLVGLRDRAEFLPDELSGGEQQRIAIARAFVGEPKVLWADEPTGNLDDATADQVLQVFRELNHSGLTIVMVTHDAAVARLAHRVIELAAGEIRRVAEQVAS